MANTPEGAPQPFARGRSFFHEVWTELKKTTWPTWPEAWRLTSVVLFVIVLVALYIGAIDAVLSWLVNHFQLIK
jgi:preprotein translocase subunit SecE